MERQGAKEMMDKRAVGMQKSILNYMQNNKKTHTQINKPRSEEKCLWTTPQKRKGDKSMNPEKFQNQSASGRPAKRRKIRFNSLLKFWGGGERGEGGGTGTTFKNEPHKENIQTNNYSDQDLDWILSETRNNPVI